MSDRPPIADPQLPCHGCAHSASTAPFPGHPSGERPCGFCTRNKDVDPETGTDPGYGEIREPDPPHHIGWPVWYDGSKPRKVPQDNYISNDRLQELLRRGA